MAAVGFLKYGGEKYPIDDRTLMHVQVVIVTKLRKREPFLMISTINAALGSGRNAFWIDNGVPIVFEYDGSRHIRINRSWLKALIDRSYTAAGLEIVPESEHPDTSPDA